MPAVHGFRRTRRRESASARADQVQAPSPQAPEEESEAGPASVRRDVGGADLLVSDLRFALLLISEARFRAMARLFGVSRDQANLVSLIALALLVERAHSTWEWLNAGPASSADGLFAAASMREALTGVAGPASRRDPLYGILLMAAVLLSGTNPAVKASLRQIKAGAHGLNVRFHGRYGWLVDLGHWRERRALRRERGTQPAAVASASS